MSDETTPPTVIDTRLVINNSLHGNKIVARENLHVKGTAVLKNLKVKEDIILKDGDELNTYLTQLESSKQDTIDSTTDLSVKGLAVHGDLTVDGASAFSDTVTVIAPTDDMHAATKHYVDTKVSHLVDNAPEALNTLNEIAAAIDNDENIASTLEALSTENKNSIDELTGNVAELETTVASKQDPINETTDLSVKELTVKSDLTVDGNVAILGDSNSTFDVCSNEIVLNADEVDVCGNLTVNGKIE